MVIYALVRRGPALFGTMRGHWRTGLAGGALQFGSYGVAIWAMTLAPIAIVAALRETSVLFGAVDRGRCAQGAIADEPSASRRC